MRPGRAVGQALVVFLIMLIATIPLGCTARAAPGNVAKIEYIVPKGRTLADVARIQHGRRVRDPKAVFEKGLARGDTIFVKDAEAVLVIRLAATGEIAVVRKRTSLPTDQPDYIVEEDIPALPTGAFAWFMQNFNASLASIASAKKLLEVTDQGGKYLLAAVRSADATAPAQLCPNAGGKSNEPIRFRSIALDGIDANLEAGDRSLFVAWRGGVEPFSAKVLDEHKSVIAETDDIRGGCSVFLPRRTYPPGNYILVLTDGNRTRFAATSISVGKNIPPMPKEIASAHLSAPVATIYYATWLTTLDDGAWTWEATQRVAALGCQWSGARRWLSRYSDLSHCKAS